MITSNQQKEKIKNQICEKLSKEKEIQKIVLFGSFVQSDNPNDIDIAVFQTSNEKYLFLSMKYRKLIRSITKILPVDIIPLKLNNKGFFLDEIEAGEVIYERGN
jgi:predicted nucleotidyltransferase